MEPLTLHSRRCLCNSLQKWLQVLPCLHFGATTMMSRHESPDTRISPPCQPDKINKLGLQTLRSAPNKWGALSTPSWGGEGRGKRRGQGEGTSLGCHRSPSIPLPGGGGGAWLSLGGGGLRVHFRSTKGARRTGDFSTSHHNNQENGLPGEHLP